MTKFFVNEKRYHDVFFDTDPVFFNVIRFIATKSNLWCMNYRKQQKQQNINKKQWLAFINIITNNDNTSDLGNYTLLKEMPSSERIDIAALFRNLIRKNIMLNIYHLLISITNVFLVRRMESYNIW